MKLRTTARPLKKRWLRFCSEFRVLIHAAEAVTDIGKRVTLDQQPLDVGGKFTFQRKVNFPRVCNDPDWK